MDFDITEIQRNIANRLARESQLDRTIELMSVIQTLVPDPKGRISKESIIIEAGYANILESDVETLLKELVRNGSLREADGYYYM